MMMMILFRAQDELKGKGKDGVILTYITHTHIYIKGIESSQTCFTTISYFQCARSYF